MHRLRTLSSVIISTRIRKKIVRNYINELIINKHVSAETEIIHARNLEAPSVQMGGLPFLMRVVSRDRDERRLPSPVDRTQTHGERIARENDTVSGTTREKRKFLCLFYSILPKRPKVKDRFAVLNATQRVTKYTTLVGNIDVTLRTANKARKSQTHQARFTGMT